MVVVLIRLLVLCGPKRKAKLEEQNCFLEVLRYARSQR